MATGALLVASSVRRILAISAVACALAVAGCSASKTASPPVPLLSITSTHVGNFTQGQNGATYTLTASNAAGAAATNGLVTVTETVPNGMTLMSMAGNGWTCAVLPTCTRSDALAAGSSYPTITVTVNVSLSASTPESNNASVSGGGSVAGNAPADQTTIVAVPQLSITSTHHGSFTQGQNGATYTVTVSNAAGAGATNGTLVTVTETVPSGMALVSMAGNGANGWTCPGGNTCTRSDALAAGSSYPTITVTVNVGGGASSGTNTVQASGGGSATAHGNDPTTVFAQQTGCTGTPTGSESLLNGKYAFVAQGFIGTNNLSPVAFAGSFTADGQGSITGGEEDSNSLAGNGGYQHLTIAAGSFYTAKTTASGNTGCLAFVLTGGTTTVVTFHIALGGIAQGGAPANVASSGRLIEFDDTTGSGSHTSGILRFQTTANFTSPLASRYAFGLDGEDSTGNHYAMAGSFTNNGADLSFDSDDAGTKNHATGGSGVINGISANDGRGLFTITSGGKASHEEAYVVNTNEVFLVQTDAFNVNTPILSGLAIVTPGAYTSTSLTGNVVVHATGNDAGVADVNLGLLTITPTQPGQNGTYAGNITDYNATSGANTNAIAGNYTVDATLGRTTLTGGTNPPVLYLTTATDGISAFIVGTDTTAIFGVLEAQSSTTVPLANYAFGTEDPGDDTVANVIGVADIVAPAPGTVNITFDQSVEGGGLLTGSMISGPLTANPNGTGTIAGAAAYVTTGTRVFIVVEAGTAVLWDLDQ